MCVCFCVRFGLCEILCVVWFVWAFVCGLVCVDFCVRFSLCGHLCAVCVGFGVLFVCALRLGIRLCGLEFLGLCE